MSDQIIVTDKKDARRLHFLQKATGTENVLRVIHTRTNGRGDVAEAADGYRLHETTKPECLPEGSALIIRDGKALHKTPGHVYEAEADPGKFPDTERIWPTEAPIASAAVRLSYLRDVAAMPQPEHCGSAEHAAYIDFYGPEQPIVFRHAHGGARAIIMPTREPRTPTVERWLTENNPDVLKAAREAIENGWEPTSERDEERRHLQGG